MYLAFFLQPLIICGHFYYNTQDLNFKDFFKNPSRENWRDLV